MWLTLLTELKPLLKFIIPICLCGILITGSYFKGYSVGKKHMEYIYNQEKLKEDQLILANQKENQDLKNKIDGLNQENDSKILELRSNYEKTINNIKYASTSELLKSKQRSEVYINTASKGSTGCSNLADYTGKLDNSLTEGRDLVKELSATLRYRDAELNKLNTYIINNKELINGTR